MDFYVTLAIVAMISTALWFAAAFYMGKEAMQKKPFVHRDTDIVIAEIEAQKKAAIGME